MIQTIPFSGFAEVGYTNTPNVIFDEIMLKLTDSELRVLLVVVRSTMGWHVKNAPMSYNEMADKAGVSRSSTIRAISTLTDAGYIQKIGTLEDNGDQGTNRYSLRFLAGGVVSPVLLPSVTHATTLVSPVTLGVVSPVTPLIRKKEIEERKEEKEITPIVPFEDLSNERLTPDVVEEIQYSDMDEIELPDEGRKSKTKMWTPGEEREFWNHWKRRIIAKPDAITRKRYRWWLAQRAVGDAISALNGYDELLKQGGSATIDDFKKRYHESLKAGISQERAQSAPFVRTQQTTGHTSPEAPSAPNAQQMAIQTWNELVISNPIDPPWDYSRDRVAELTKATQDPVFMEKLPEICAKAEAYAKANKTKSRNFRWMIRSFGPGAGNWWDFLNQEDAPRFKSKPTHEESQANVMKILMEGK